MSDFTVNINASPFHINDSLRYSDNKTILINVSYKDKYYINLTTDGESLIIDKTTGEEYQNNLINDWILDNFVYIENSNFGIVKRNYHIIEFGYRIDNCIHYDEKEKYTAYIGSIDDLVTSLKKRLTKYIIDRKDQEVSQITRQRGNPCRVSQKKTQESISNNVSR